VKLNNYVINDARCSILLIASVGFLIQSASPAIAKNSNITQNGKVFWVSSGGYAHAIDWYMYDGRAGGTVVGRVRLE